MMHYTISQRKQIYSKARCILREWDESEHPRDDDGKFTGSGGAGGDADWSSPVAALIEDQQVDNDTKELAGNHLLDGLPNLTNYKIIGEPTFDYNCAAHALGDHSRFWWPGVKHMYWPSGAGTSRNSVKSFDQLFDQVGGKATQRHEVEKGFVKVALFVEGLNPTHLALQTPDGKWSSKCGANVLIVHDSLEELEGGIYGDLAKIYKVPITKWSKIKDM